MRQFLTCSCLLYLAVCMQSVHAKDALEPLTITFTDSAIPNALDLGTKAKRWKVSDQSLVNSDVKGNDTFGLNIEPTEKLTLSFAASTQAINSNGGFWGFAMILKDQTRVQVFSQNKHLRYYIRKPGDPLKPINFARLPNPDSPDAKLNVTVDGNKLTASADEGETFVLDLPSAGIQRIEFQAYHMQVALHQITVDASVKLQQVKDDSEHLKSQLDVPSDAVQRPSDSNALVIFYIGDSITRHGFSKDTIQRLGWDHLAGMAATDASKDFAHLFADHVQSKNKGKNVQLFFHSKGGAGAAATRYATLGTYIPLKPDIVVVQLGEHEKQHNGVDALRTNYHALLSTMQQWESKPIILCVGVWNPIGKGQRTQYTGWAVTVNQTMAEVCKSLAIPYASMEKHALNPNNSGWGTSKGVQWHPNDAGMQAYADELIQMYDEQTSK
ncbi:MAG TPA: hypothetical protein DER01_03990 [Phycisphaerales bacterium]|nr:hypothetical protein [Phycisphaerales bacterium]